VTGIKYHSQQQSHTLRFCILGKDCVS